jgi:Spy/CpxP family protein refolding chaperone
MEQGSRTKLVAAAVLALVFGSGMVVGYAADGAKGAEAAEVGAAPATPEAPPAKRVPVYEQLHPTDEQNAKIDSIMRDHRDQMVKLHEEFRVARESYQARYDALISDTREAIAGVFPPDEAARYRELLAEFDRQREQARSSKPDQK